MEFLLTSYIYPLKDPVLLSSHLGFCLDNPRTELELKVVSDYLLRAYESGYDFKFPVQSEEPIVTIENALSDFREAFSSRDMFVAETFKNYSSDTVFDFLASIWIIARFDDEGLGNELRQEHQRMRDNSTFGFIMLEDEHPLIKKSEDLASYCFLLSLLSHTENNSYFGRTFLIDPQPLDDDRPVEKVWSEFLVFHMASHHYPNSQDELSWMFLPYAKERLCQVASKLDVAFANDQTSKLLYIGSLLKIVGYDTRDTRTRLVLLSSIIELLLTHNPDTTRFNVEDSINKQFQLKTSILIYLNDKSNDINAIKNRLKIIYQQRSNIAHGNFQAFEKYKSSLSKKEGKEEYLDDLVSDLYRYLRAILEEYLKDPSFIEFLKNN